MSYKVDNAIILAAGLSSRFAPISYEKHKSFVTIHGEKLIERQISQLKEAGVREIVVVVGYKKEQFEYLIEKYGVILVENPLYAERNTHGSIYAARDYLKNSYICLSDNYFTDNPFENEVEDSYYAAVYGEGKTAEWCLEFDENDTITKVTIGGEDSWYMLGHAFFTESFSRKLLEIIEAEYNLPETKDKYWEDLYMEHIEELPMQIRRYDQSFLYEFDSLDELRKYDSTYQDHSESIIMQKLAEKYKCREGEIVNIESLKNREGIVEGIKFSIHGERFTYLYSEFEQGK